MKSGALEFGPGVDVSLLPAHLAACLKNARASAVDINACEVSFKGGIFRLVGNWNVLVPFGSGTLTVDPVAKIVRYGLNSTQLVTIVSAFTALAVILSWIKHSLVVLPMAGFLWAWLVGGNLLIGYPRFRRFLRQALRDAPQQSSRSVTPS
jgi:hypothetical protein